jgi:hypothetical protein
MDDTKKMVGIRLADGAGSHNLKKFLKRVWIGWATFRGVTSTGLF